MKGLFKALQSLPYRFKGSSALHPKLQRFLGFNDVGKAAGLQNLYRVMLPTVVVNIIVLASYDDDVDDDDRHHRHHHHHYHNPHRPAPRPRHCRRRNPMP